MIINALILVGLLILSGFFSGIETALMSLSIAKVKSLVKQGKRGAETLMRLKQNPHKLIITILIGNNLVNIGAAAFATVVFTELLGSGGVGIATGVMTLLILVFGEITPKTFASQNAEKISLIVAKPIELMSILLSPVVKILEVISKAINKLLGSSGEQALSEEELRAIVTMGKDEGVLSSEAAEIMQNVLDFEGTRVTAVMTPKASVHMLDGSKKLEDVLDLIIKSPFSRFPIYLKDDDNVVGVVDVDDVLKKVRQKKLNTAVRKMVKPAYFVPESKEIDDLLVELEDKKTPMAIVVDEYRNVVGIVTVEDILEEVVGDIFDKSHHRSQVHIRQVSSTLAEVDAKASFEEVNKELHLGLKETQFSTIAGFVEHKLQKIPKKGERVELKNVVIEVGEVVERGIKSVKIINTKNRKL